MRRLSAVLVAALAAAVIAGLAPPAAAATVTYLAPVDGPIVDRFRPPRTAYGAGNRGLTYQTTPDAIARASAPGRVTFAGQVGGALHVVVQHADGVRTSYSFLRSVATRVGSTVKQGDVVGRVGSSFHFGARIGDAYVDPEILLASGPARVHLVPDGEFRERGADNDHRALVSVVADRLGAISGAALDWARDAAGDVTRASLEHLVTVLDQIVNLGEMAGPFAAMAAALANILQSVIESCTPKEVLPPPPQQRRIGVYVAGLTSDSDHKLSKRLRASERYAPGDTYDFSYRGGNNPYGAADTTGDLRERAADLRVLLDAIARDNPGVPVDLIAHSQGGLIAREALAEKYDGTFHQLPPVAHLVTFATPHHGADIATIGAYLRHTVAGEAMLDAAGGLKGVNLNDVGVRQLAESSDFIHELNYRPLREGVSYTSIASMMDLVAPGVRARVAGATNVLVDAKSLGSSHSAITGSEEAHREMALALADMPPTCQSIATTAVRSFTSASITGVEDTGQLFVMASPIR